MEVTALFPMTTLLLASTFAAQDVMEAGKDFAYINAIVDNSEVANGGYYSIRYSHFIPALVKTAQEQQQQISDLKQQVEELKQLVSKLLRQNNNSNTEVNKHL